VSDNADAKQRASEQKTQTRSDALANQERLLAAAVTAMLREGRQVPMASIARDAGVGVGTLYRNYPTRDALLAALTVRSFQLVQNVIADAETVQGPAISAIDAFLTSTIAHRDQLVLPLHGGPSVIPEEAQHTQKQIYSAMNRILDRGRQDRTIRSDVLARDVVFFGALLAQPLTQDDTQLVSNLVRQQQVFLAGLAPSAPALGNGESQRLNNSQPFEATNSG
jgi:AcrR family transcriptional regulator